jgi:hypothetical protein
VRRIGVGPAKLERWGAGTLRNGFWRTSAVMRVMVCQSSLDWVRNARSALFAQPSSRSATKYASLAPAATTFAPLSPIMRKPHIWLETAEPDQLALENIGCGRDEITHA